MATTLHKKIFDRLKKAIESGRYPPGSRLPTDTQLPQLFKVSRITVQRALTDLVREGLLVRRRGDGTYVRDLSAPPLLPGRQLALGIVWPRSVSSQALSASPWGELTRGILTQCGIDPLTAGGAPLERPGLTGYHWLQRQSGLRFSCLASGEAESGRRPAPGVLRDLAPDGLLVLGAAAPDWLAELEDSRIPAVQVDAQDPCPGEGLDSVSFDPVPGFRAAFRALLAAGVRSLHFLGTHCEATGAQTEAGAGSAPVAQALGRWLDGETYRYLAAYRQALELEGLPPAPETIHLCAPGLGSVLEVGERLAGLPAAQRPQALFCRDLLKAEFLNRLFLQRNQRLIVASIAGPEYAGPLLPLLLDRVRLGALAAEVLLSRLLRPSRPVLRTSLGLGLGAGWSALAQAPPTPPDPV